MRIFGRDIDTLVPLSEKINKLMTTLRHFIWLIGLIFGLPIAALFFPFWSESWGTILPNIGPNNSTTTQEQPREEPLKIPSDETLPQLDPSEQVPSHEASRATEPETEVDDRSINRAPPARSLVDGQDAAFCDGALGLTLHMPDTTSSNRIPDIPNGASFFVRDTSPLERKMLQVGSPITIANCTVLVTEIVRQRDSVRDFNVVIMEIPEE